MDVQQSTNMIGRGVFAAIYYSTQSVYAKFHSLLINSYYCSVSDDITRYCFGDDVTI